MKPWNWPAKSITPKEWKRKCYVDIGTFYNPFYYITYPQINLKQKKTNKKELQIWDDFSLKQDETFLNPRNSKKKKKKVRKENYPAVGVDIQSSFKEIRYVTLQIFQHCIPLPLYHIDSSLCQLDIGLAVPGKNPKEHEQNK